LAGVLAATGFAVAGFAAAGFTASLGDVFGMAEI